MKKIVVVGLFAGSLAIGLSVGLSAQQHPAMHPLVNAAELTWMAAPPGLPPGAQVAVLAGDPSKEGPFVIRAKTPAGYRVPAHTHAQDEYVTVISGSLHFGMGPKLDTASGTRLTAGGFAHAARGMQHYVWSTEEAVIQVHGQGPFDITYVNPADDPRK